MDFLKLLFGVITICIAVLAGYIGVQEVSKKFGLQDADEFGLSDIHKAKVDFSNDEDVTSEEEPVKDSQENISASTEECVSSDDKKLVLNAPGAKWVLSLFAKILVNVVILAVVVGFFIFAIILFIKLGSPEAADQTGMSLFK